MNDVVNHPPHYQSAGIEVIDVIESFGLDQSFCLGNVVKYILRHGRKGAAVEDLRKAAWYLNREIGQRAGDGSALSRPLQSFDLIYLASPYSKYAQGLERAFEDAARLAARLLQVGINVYSPITHSHPIAEFGHIDPTDHSIWLPFEERIMKVCQALLVAQMSGWDKSYGVGKEIEHFSNAGKPIFYLDPDTLAHSPSPVIITRAA